MGRSLVLFDIDKTLIDSSKVKDQRAFPTAIKRVYGVEASLDEIEPHGMTDQQIILELAMKGVGREEAEKGLENCMKVMESIYRENIDEEEVSSLRGADRVLEFLERKGVGLGLVTGNLESIAREKLRQVELEHFFPVGGFGDDGIERSKLVEKAVERAEEHYGEEFNTVVLVGDSPKDVGAGKEAGVKTVGVTMGVYSREELERCDPELIIETWNRKSAETLLEI